MTPQELALALKRLDDLQLKREGFRSWLNSDKTAHDEYYQEKQRIENAFPGLHVVYVDVTYQKTHALIAE